MKREITSLALVKAMYAQFEYKRDYIENFVPFVANLVRKRNLSSVVLDKLDDFINIFREEFGFNIPYHPMLTILERCRKRGLFKREHGQLIPFSETIQKYDFGSLVGQKEAKINELLQDLVDYGKNKFSVDISREEAQDIFLGYLSSHDMDILFAAEDQAILPLVRTTPNLKYVLGNYIAYAKDSNVTMFNLITEIAVGHILANTILYADKLQKFSGRFNGLFFYIDARFIFRLLGYEGALFRSAYNELLNALREQEAKLCVFNHTFEEVTDVLKGAIRWVDTSEYDPTLASNVTRFYQNAGKNKADVQHDLATIENKMEKFGILVVPIPEFMGSSFRQAGEEKIQEQIIRVYSEKNIYFDPIEKQYTIEKDTKSISAIYRLRQTLHPSTMKQAQHFFLTSNSSLAYAARCYEISDSGKERFIPTCVTDIFLGTLVWMQSPVRWIELNQKRFIADCMALLNPSPIFIKKLVDEARKLKDAGRLNNDEFVVVRSSIYIQQILMKETYGDPDSIKAESIEDVVNRIRCEATAPLKEKIEKKDAEVIELQQKNMAIEKESQEYKDKIESIAVTSANKFTNTISSVLWIFVFISFAVSFFDWIPRVKTIIRILSAFSLIAGFGFGWNIKNIRKAVFLNRLSKMRIKYGISD